MPSLNSQVALRPSERNPDPPGDGPTTVAAAPRAVAARPEPSARETGNVATLPHAPAARDRTDIRCEVLDRAAYADWDRLVDLSPHGTVFHYSWWLETVAPDFQIIVTRNDRGTIVGGLPLPRQRRAGLRLSHSPKLAPYLGPIFDLSSAHTVCDRLFLMRSHGEALGRYVGPFDSFRCLTGATAPDLQGFLWAGFRASLAYTFRIPAGRSPNEITEGMTRTHFQKLTKARRTGLSVTSNGDIEDLIQLNKVTFEKQTLTAPYPYDVVRKLWPAAHGHGSAQLYVAKTTDGSPAAALLTVHDRKTTYQIISGVQKGLRDVPGAYLVLWQAAYDALSAGRAFDFEGSAIRGVEAFYRRWGADAVPVWCVEKSDTLRGIIFQLLLNRRIAAAKNNL